MRGGRDCRGRGSRQALLGVSAAQIARHQHRPPDREPPPGGHQGRPEPQSATTPGDLNLEEPRSSPSSSTTPSRRAAGERQAVAALARPRGPAAARRGRRARGRRRRGRAPARRGAAGPDRRGGRAGRRGAAHRAAGHRGQASRWPRRGANVAGARVQVVKELVYPEDRLRRGERGRQRRGERGSTSPPSLTSSTSGLGRDRPRRLRLRRRGGSGSSTPTASTRAENEEVGRGPARAAAPGATPRDRNNEAWASAGDRATASGWPGSWPAIPPRREPRPDLRGRRHRHHSLSKAMDHRHPMLFTLLGVRAADRLLRRWPRRVPQDRHQGQHAEGRDHDHDRGCRRCVVGHDRQALVAQTRTAWTPACSARSWSGATSPSRSSGSSSARSSRRPRGRQRRSADDNGADEASEQRRLTRHPSPTRGRFSLWRTALCGIETIE